MRTGERDPRATDAIDGWSELKGARSRHEADWDETQKLILARPGSFGMGTVQDWRREKPISAAAHIAAQNMSAGIYGTLTNPANRWFALGVPDQALKHWQPMREWLDLAGRRTLASFAPGTSPFYPSAMQAFLDTTCLGNAAHYSERPPGERAILDITLSLAEVCFEVDAFGRVTEVIRKFRLSPVAAAHQFGIKALPPRLAQQAEKGSRDRVDFYHHVKRNHAFQAGRLGPTGKRWSSIYVAEEGGTVLRHSGYDEMPFHAPRWQVDTGEVYARGQAFIALSAARRIDLMGRANLRAGQQAADPIMIAPDKETIPLAGRFRPGSTVYGGMSAGGRRLVEPLNTFQGTGLSLEMEQYAVDEVRDAFHWSLMNLAGRTGMTATEVIERQEEKLRLMAPHMGRLQEEFLAPKIAQRFALLFKAGQIPPPPPEAAGMELQVEYTSAASMAAKSAEGAAIVRLLADLTPLADIKPEVMDRISPDDAVERLAEARGVPAEVLTSRQEAAQLREQRAEAQQAAQALEAAQAGGGVARDLGAAGLLEGAA
ncbi:MAG: portal protein [Pseudomonadota bacterium]